MRDAQGYQLAGATTEAARRAGARNEALALVHERLGLRPASRPNREMLSRAEALAA